MVEKQAVNMAEKQAVNMVDYKRCTWLIDAGHGGMVNGVYTTAPSKMFTHPNGLVVYEGVVNRQVANKLAYLLQGANIPYRMLVPENEDISLTERGRRINSAYKELGGNICTVSLHGNAGGGTGFEVFTSVGESDSDAIAEVFINEMAKVFPTEKKRVDVSDGDQDKEANFAILKNNGAAILCEAFFMDRLEDAQLMVSDQGQSNIALAYFNAIKKITSEGTTKKVTKKNEKV